MAAASAARRHPVRIASLVAAGVLLVLAAAAAAFYGWLRTYAPLTAVRNGGFAPGPGLAADIEPVRGSGGKPVFIPAVREGESFDTAFTLHNTGRIAVTVSGLASSKADAALAPTMLLATDSSTASAEPSHLHAFRPLRLDPGDDAIVVVRWAIDCSAATGEASVDRVPLRYDYLSLFKRTGWIRLPFAVTLRCSK
jgi:hypothetical protein